MAKLPEMYKTRLKEAGLWSTYLGMVSDAKFNPDVESNVAKADAVEELLGERPAMKGNNFVHMVSTDEDGALPGEAGSGDQAKPDSVADGRGKVKPVKVAATKKTSGRCASDEVFAGASQWEVQDFYERVATEVEQVRWVARHIDDPTVSFRDAPDAGAWNILQECQRHLGFRQMFWTQIWPKIMPSRAALEGQTERDLGDIEAKNVIKQIQEIKKDAEERECTD